MLKKLLIPYAYRNKIRLGPNRDGGYVVAGNLIQVERLLSLGCSNQTGFEEDFLKHNKRKNFECKIYDLQGSCDLASKEENVFFIKERVDNLENVIEHKLPTVIQMDIEGSEFDCLSSYEGFFSNVWQMIIEFHFYPHVTKNKNIKEIFDKINKYFYLIHMHGNNHKKLTEEGIPQVLECTYVNKNLFSEEPEKETSAFPVDGLDFPNTHTLPEMILDWWV